jgi:hypothetical protein
MARKIEAMYQMFGRYSGREPKQCKDCNNFLRRRYNKIYRKCTVYGCTSSEATDWNASYEACEMFNKPYEGNPVIEILKHKSKSKDDETLKGQMSIDDWISR